MFYLFDDDYIQKMYEKEIYREAWAEGWVEDWALYKEDGYVDMIKGMVERMYADRVPFKKIAQYVGCPLEVIGYWLELQI